MIKVSPRRFIIWQLLVWHFYDTPKSILEAFKNFLVFNFKFFSVGLLLKTLFSHWRRYKESYGRGLDIKRYFSVLVGNLTSRILGAMVRTAVIFIGLLVEFFIFLTAIFVLLTWLFLPILLLVGLYFGLKFLI